MLTDRVEVHRAQRDGESSRDESGQRSRFSKSECRSERTKIPLTGLLREIPRMKELQWEVVAAQIHARQKMREVGFKRSDVSEADASFMKELQSLQAQGRLHGFEELTRLADACQSVRDGLGPLEDEGIEAQRKFEGHMWELRQVEDAIFDKYESEFGEIYEESSTSSDSSSAHNILELSSPINGGLRKSRSQLSMDKTSYHESDVVHMARPHNRSESQEKATAPIRFERPGTSSSSGVYTPIQEPPLSNVQIQDTHQESMLLGLEVRAASGDQEPRYEPILSLEPENLVSIGDEGQHGDSELDSDSGLDDIDQLQSQESTYASQKRHSSTESFPMLLTQFGTKRDRIYKWLLHTMLISKSEANLIGLQLQTESQLSPSPWAQLIISYFEYDYNNSKIKGTPELSHSQTWRASDVYGSLNMPQLNEMLSISEAANSGTINSAAFESKAPSLENPEAIFTGENDNLMVH